MFCGNSGQPLDFTVSITILKNKLSGFRFLSGSQIVIRWTAGCTKSDGGQNDGDVVLLATENVVKAIWPEMLIQLGHFLENGHNANFVLIKIIFWTSTIGLFWNSERFILKDWISYFHISIFVQ